MQFRTSRRFLSRLARRRAARMLAAVAGLPILFSAMAVCQAAAATYTWDPTGTNPTAPAGGTGTWDTTSAFWSNGTTDSAWPNNLTTLADFAGTAGTVTMGAALSAQGAEFDTGGYTLNTNGNVLTMGTSGIVTTNATGTTTISGTGSLTTAAVENWNVASGGTLQFNAGFSSTSTASNAFLLTSNGITNITGTFTTAGKTVLMSTLASGVNTFNLSGTETFETTANDYVGIQGTTVNVTAGSAAFSAVNAFYIGNGGALATTLNVTGGTVTFASNVAVRIGNSYNGSSGTNTGNGVLTVGGGTGAASFTTGTTTTGGIVLGFTGSTGTVNLNTNGTLSTARAFSAGAAGNAAINFNGGTLQATAASLAIPNTVATTLLNNGGTIDTQAFAVTVASPLLHGGTNATDGGLTKLGAGVLTLGGVNTYTGPTTLTGAGGIAFANAAGTTQTLAGNITGVGTLSQTGAGMTVLSGANSYSGATTISAGVLQAASSTALGTGAITVSGAGTTTAATGGTLQLTGGVALTNTINGFQARNDPGSTTTTPHIENVSGNNSLSSNLTISSGGGSGAVIASDAGTLTLSGNLSNTSNSTYARPFIFTGAGNTTVGGTILLGATNNPTAITKEGAGILTLTGTNTYTGPTMVTGGTLAISGSINGSTTINVSAGALTLSNTAAIVLADTSTLTLASGTTLNLNAAGGTSEIIGSLVLNGTTEPAGTYNLASLQALNSGVNFSSANGETLTVTMGAAVPEPSTFACMLGALGGFMVYARRRMCREV